MLFLYYFLRLELNLNWYIRKQSKKHTPWSVYAFDPRPLPLNFSAPVFIVAMR